MIVDPSPLSFHSRFPQFTLDRRWAVEPAWSRRWETQVWLCKSIPSMLTIVILICNKVSCYVSYSVSLSVVSGIKDDKV